MSSRASSRAWSRPGHRGSCGSCGRGRPADGNGGLAAARSRWRAGAVTASFQEGNAASVPTLWQSLCGPPRCPRAGRSDERSAENNAIESIKEGAMKNRRRHPWTRPARVSAECQWSRRPATTAEITFSATPGGRAGATAMAVFPTRRTHPTHRAAPLPPRAIHDDRTDSRHATGSLSPTLGHA